MYYSTKFSNHITVRIMPFPAWHGMAGRGLPRGCRGGGHTWAASEITPRRFLRLPESVPVPQRRTAEPEFGGARYLLSQSRTSGRARVLHAGPPSSYLGASNHGAAFAPAPLPPLTMRPAAEIHYRCGTSGNQHVPAAGRCRRSGTDVCCCWCVFGWRLKSCSRICKTQKPVIKSILEKREYVVGSVVRRLHRCFHFSLPRAKTYRGGKKPLFCFFLCTSARMRVWYCGIHFKVSLCWFLIG